MSNEELLSKARELRNALSCSHDTALIILSLRTLAAPQDKTPVAEPKEKKKLWGKRE